MRGRRSPGYPEGVLLGLSKRTPSDSQEKIARRSLEADGETPWSNGPPHRQPRVSANARSAMRAVIRLRRLRDRYITTKAPFFEAPPRFFGQDQRNGVDFCLAGPPCICHKKSRYIRCLRKAEGVRPSRFLKRYRKWLVLGMPTSWPISDMVRLESTSSSFARSRRMSIR